MLKSKKFQANVFLCLLYIVLPLLLIGCSKKNPEPPQSLINVGYALNVYAFDNNDYYPSANSWCDEIIKMATKDEVDRDYLSYLAINPYCSAITHPDMVVVFETEKGWNQYGGRELLSAERNNGKGAFVLLGDGRIEFIKTEEFKNLLFKKN